jgi:RNA recognition motif-containing protein
MNNHANTGNSKGFGFVTYSSPAEAQAAIDNLNGIELDGRTIRVNMSKPRESGDRGGGGGYGGGGTLPFSTLHSRSISLLDAVSTAVCDRCGIAQNAVSRSLCGAL